METASIKASDKASTFGSAKLIIEGGNTSGTPPTFVDTTNNPHEAATWK